MVARAAEAFPVEDRTGPAVRTERSGWWAAGRWACRSPTTAVGLVVLAALSGIALLAPLLAPYAADGLNPVERLQGPSPRHWFGTDFLGQDVLSRTIFGSRVSLVVGFTVAAVSGSCGTAIGVSAGFFRRLDPPLMRVMDGLMAFPGLLLALALISIAGPHLWAVLLVLTVVQTPRTARLMRSAVLGLREHPYIEAARALGMGDGRILLRHVLPNVTAPLLVQATFSFASAVLAEAALSFLGAGIPPTTPSWGNIIGQGRAVIQQAPWLCAFPGLAIALTVLSISVIGDGLRDEADPTLTRGA